MQAGWSRWRLESQVICNREIAARVKEKVYKMVHDLETVALTKRQEAEKEVAELKM